MADALNTYLIRFMFNTDCRWEEQVKAFNEVEALTLAMNSHHNLSNQIRNWTENGKGFKLTIEWVGRQSYLSWSGP